MDDAHQIVLVGLEHAGVTLPTCSAGAHDLGQAELVAICSQAVSLIQGGVAGQKPLPTLLPVAMAEKFRVCTDLAGAIKELGYPADLSFHQASTRSLTFPTAIARAHFSTEVGCCLMLFERAAMP